MNVIIRTGFQKVSHQIFFQPRTEKKGHHLVNAKHVQNVHEFRKNGESYLIVAEIIRQASVSEAPYKTSLTINAARQVTGVSCNCVYNKSERCKHVAALIHYVNTEESLSKTNHEQEWGKPTVRQFSKEQYSKGKYFYEMFPPAQKPSDIKLCAVDVYELKESCALKSMLIAASRNQDERDKLSIKHLLISMLLTVEVNLKREDCEACLYNFFIFCNEHPIYKNIYVLESSLQNFYETHIVMDEEKIVKLCYDTVGQSTCDKWFAARVLRVSASKNTHNIKTRAKKTLESLVLDMLFPKKVSTPATQYGSKHECDAKKEYEQIFHCDIKQIGVIVCKSNPWLCASLDGVVIENGCITKIVELKCPFTCTDQPVVDYSNKKCNVSYLYFLGDNVELRESAIYYTQCQIQMYVSGLTICDLFIYSPVTNRSCVIQVHRNETFLENIIYKCENFYFNYYLPAVRDKMSKSLTSVQNTSSEEVQNVRHVINNSFSGKDISNIRLN